MKPFDFALLCDENIHPAVATYLQKQGYDAEMVTSQGLNGQTDVALMEYAYKTRCVIITHDSDFGTLAIRQGQPFVGIVYLRPGSIKSNFTIETVNAIIKDVPEVQPPFIIVARRKHQTIQIRIRQ